MVIKEIANTSRMIQLEISLYEFENNDFDFVWDSIREKYDEKHYSIKKFEKEKYKVIVKLYKKKIKK